MAKKAKKERVSAPLQITIDVKAAFKLFTDWHEDEITDRRGARNTAVRLMTRLRAEALVADPTPKPLHILWGESPEHGDEAKTYLFNTGAERDAFLRGVEAMDGYLGWREVDFEGDKWCSECDDAHAGVKEDKCGKVPTLTNTVTEERRVYCNDECRQENITTLGEAEEWVEDETEFVVNEKCAHCEKEIA